MANSPKSRLETLLLGKDDFFRTDNGVYAIDVQESPAADDYVNLDISFRPAKKSPHRKPVSVLIPHAILESEEAIKSYIVRIQNQLRVLLRHPYAWKVFPSPASADYGPWIVGLKPSRPWRTPAKESRPTTPSISPRTSGTLQPPSQPVRKRPERGKK